MRWFCFVLLWLIFSPVFFVINMLFWWLPEEAYDYDDEEDPEEISQGPK